MNAINNPHVVMVPPAATPMDRISVSAPRAMKDVIVPSTQMIAPRSHVRMVEHVWMVSVIILASASTDLMASTAKWISMNVSPGHARMVPHVTITSTPTHAPAN